MRILLMWLCLWSTAGVCAQNYYVALVKGKVHYNGQLLKPRMKIELHSSLRFTTAKDYVKVSGPGGIHTIRPQQRSSGGFEFLRAVTAELFPKAKPVGSHAYATWEDPTDRIGLHDDNQYHPQFFAEGERRSVHDVLHEKYYQRLYWIFVGSNGQPQLQRATVNTNCVILGTEEFEVRNISHKDTSAVLAVVRDTTGLTGQLLGLDMYNVHLNTNLNLSQGANKYSEKADAKNLLGSKYDPASSRLYPNVMSLAYLPATDRIIPAEDIFPDMLYHFRVFAGQDINEFLNSSSMTGVEGYGSVLMDRYGEMNLVRVADAFYHYLVSHYSDDPSLQPAILAHQTVETIIKRIETRKMRRNRRHNYRWYERASKK